MARNQKGLDLVSTIKCCEVCGNKNLESVLNLGLHPLCDDLIEIGDSRVCNEYPIEILFCNVCYTAHQKFQVPKKELFKKTYHYRSRMTGSVLAGMKDLVNNCENRFGDLDKKLVLDVGCNDGSLLDFFKKKGCSTVGVDPTDAAQESKHLTYQAFFDKDFAKFFLNEFGKPDFITFTNVFAHIEDLPGLLNNLKLLLGKNTILVIENHYLGDILKKKQFDTYYHEHPRTYSYESFKYIAKSLGIKLLDVDFVSRYGGNIRAYLGNQELLDVKIPDKDESTFKDQYSQTLQDMKMWVTTTKKWINDYVDKNGKLRAKAFPGRAAILVKLLNLDESHISAVYEIKGSIKVGHYVPGTRIPILPESELYNLDNQDETILNLAWHIPNEVRKNLKSNGYIGKVLDIKDIQ